LEVKINEISPSEKQVEVTYNYDEIKNDIEKEVKQQAKKIQLPGFRKGKVPVAMMKKMYGDAMEHEASEKVASDKFWNVAKENELNPIGQPLITDLKFNPGENLFFKVKFEVIPHISVSDYKSLEIEVPDYNVKDEEVEHEIWHILKSNSTTEPADIVGDDNNFIIKVELSRIDENSNPIQGSKNETMDIDLSEERINKEILRNSKGKKVGDSFNFTFTRESKVKNDKGEDELKTESLTFKADIKEIKKIILPELNDELAAKVTKGKVTNVYDFKNNIRKDFQNYYEREIENMIHGKLMKQIVDKNDFVPPTTLVNNLLSDFVQKEEEYWKKQGIKKFDRQDAEKRLRETAEFEVKWYLIRNSIIEAEKLDIPEEELKELAKKDAEKTGITEEKLISYYKSSNYKEKLLDKKLFDFLKENSNIKKVKPEPEIRDEKKVEDKND
jgi:trigger factor